MTKRSPGISLANAPVSYGAFEVTVGIDPNTPDGIAILDEVSSAGYEGIDLGPVGYLGVGNELGMRLADRNLGLAGAYLEFPFADSARLPESLKNLDAMLDTFDAVARFITGPQPRPTIADNGSLTAMQTLVQEDVIPQVATTIILGSHLVKVSEVL